MHALVARAMKEKNIDISKNKSKKVTEEIINEADLIILMSPDLKEFLKNTNKEIETWNIPDIIARETDKHLYPGFIKVRDSIEEKVKNDTKATIRCIPLDSKGEKGNCIICGKNSSRRVIFAKAY